MQSEAPDYSHTWHSMIDSAVFFAMLVLIYLKPHSTRRIANPSATATTDMAEIQALKHTVIEMKYSGISWGVDGYWGLILLVYCQPSLSGGN